MDFLLFFPVLIPLATAMTALLVRKTARATTAVSITGAVFLAIACFSLAGHVFSHGIVSSQAAGWAAPAGISLVADTTSALLLAASSLLNLLVVVSCAGAAGDNGSEWLHPLLQVMVAGVGGSYLAGDVFNLYVWFEVMLIASFVLVGLGNTREHLEAVLKYMVLNLLASVFFLCAAGALYGISGTLNMADAGMWVQEHPAAAGLPVLAALFFLAFAVKAGLFPFFVWLPASYPVLPPALAALFSALLTKVGIYALLRFSALIFPREAAAAQPLLLVLAATTMVAGVLAAAVQFDLRRLLSFHIVSQIGYILFAVALFTPLSLAGGLFFILHLMFSKSALFMVTGMIEEMFGTTDLKTLGGLYRENPRFSILFLLPALSLAGVPPLSGFWGKYLILKAGLDAGAYAVVAVAIAVSVMTLFSMVKVWVEAFWKPGRQETPRIVRRPAAAAARSTWVMSLLVLAAGMAVEPLIHVTMQGAKQLTDPLPYRSAALGARK